MVKKEKEKVIEKVIEKQGISKEKAGIDQVKQMKEAGKNP